MKDKTFTLNNKEFVFLAALLGEDVVLGVNDPFLGWLAEQVEEEWERLSTIMLKNGLLSLDEGGQYKVGIEYEKMVRQCCSPDIWISVAGAGEIDADTSFVMNVRLSDKSLVKAEKKPLTDCVELSLINYEDELGSIVFNELDLGMNFQNNGTSFDIPQKEFKNISNCADIPDRGDDYVRFFNTYREPVSKFLVNIGGMSGNSAEMESFVIIKGEDILWRIGYYEENNKQMVSIRQSDEADIKNVINNNKLLL